MIDVDIKKKLHGSIGGMMLKIKVSIKERDFVAVFGESGSGKTTFLRILAGLEKSDGQIKVGNEIWQNSKKFLPPQKRKIGFVFQDYALFPNMSIEENLFFVSKDKNLANELLEITQLQELKDRLPNTLSGGQKQRVALIRAMMNKPKLLLMDEPLSALDPKMRLRLQQDILLLHKKFETTTIFVSHDPSEIYRLANRVVVINHGNIIDDGAPKKILLRITGSQKFSFIGEVLDITKVDVVYIAIISIGQQIVEIVMSPNEAKNIKIGQKISVSTKAFNPTLNTNFV